MKIKDTSTLLCLAVISVAISSVNAATVIQPTDVDASSVFSSTFPEELVINGSGLSDATIVETGDPVPSPWPTNKNNGSSSPQSNWISGTTAPDEWIMFDLGQSYELGGMHIWNYNHTGFESRGIKEVNIKFATSLTGTFS